MTPPLSRIELSALEAQVAAARALTEIATALQDIAKELERLRNLVDARLGN